MGDKVKKYDDGYESDSEESDHTALHLGSFSNSDSDNQKIEGREGSTPSPPPDPITTTGFINVRVKPPVHSKVVD